MIKVFLKHYIYEKCIDLIFDGLIKTFKKKPEPKYEILNVETTDGGDGFITKKYTVKHNGELRTISISQKGDMKDAFINHGYTSEEADRELEAILISQIEHEIRVEEVGIEQTFKEETGYPLPEPGQVIIGNTETGEMNEMDFDNLPSEVKEQIEALKEKYGDDFAAPGEFDGFSLEDKNA